MRPTFIFLTFILCAMSSLGQTMNKGEAIPFDSTKYYRRLFADNTEFDIRKFKPFPSREKAYNDNQRMLFDAIKPAPGYVYWECRYYMSGEAGIGKLIVAGGDPSYAYLAATQKRPDHGFFVGCLPNICYSYITAIREDKTICSIDNETKLTEFMGNVDNIEEVLLHIKANGYWYDENTLIGGAYREESDRYLLYIMESSSFPVTFRSVKAILYKNGKFEVANKVTYKTSNMYIMN